LDQEIPHEDSTVEARLAPDGNPHGRVHALVCGLAWTPRDAQSVSAKAEKLRVVGGVPGQATDVPLVKLRGLAQCGFVHVSNSLFGFPGSNGFCGASLGGAKCLS